MRFLFYILGLLLILSLLPKAFAQNAVPKVVLLDEKQNETKSSPTGMLEKFFSGVKSGNLDDALAVLTKNSLLVHKPEDIATLKKGTQQALDKYGEVAGFEVLETKTVGKSLLRITCISLGEEMPLRWKFFFYKTKDTWRLLDMRVDSGIVDLFDDLGRTK